MVLKLLGGYESSKWNVDMRSDYQVSPILVTFSRHSYPYHPFSSYRLERGLSRVHETAVFERRNGCLPFETCENDRTFWHAPKARTYRSSPGHERPCGNADFPLIGLPTADSKYTPNGHRVFCYLFSRRGFRRSPIYLRSTSISHTSFPRPQHTRISIPTHT